MFGMSDAFNALIYPQKRPEDVQFLQQQAYDLPSHLTQTGLAFMQKARTMFERFNGEEAIEFARQVVQKAGVNYYRDSIVSLTCLNELQEASVVMQRWVMANPMVRKRFHDQQLDGYCTSYIDVQPDAIGQEHYDYRRATDGMFEFSEEHGWKFHDYGLDKLHEGDRHLTFSEKDDIKQTWDYCNLLLTLAKNDFTNKDGGFL